MLSKFWGKNDFLSRIPHLIKQELDISDMHSLKTFPFHALSEVSKNISHQKREGSKKMRRHEIQKQVIQDKQEAREFRADGKRWGFLRRQPRTSAPTAGEKEASKGTLRDLDTWQGWEVISATILET